MKPLDGVKLHEVHFIRCFQSRVKAALSSGNVLIVSVINVCYMLVICFRFIKFSHRVPYSIEMHGIKVFSFIALLCTSQRGSQLKTFLHIVVIILCFAYVIYFSLMSMTPYSSLLLKKLFHICIKNVIGLQIKQ